MSAATAIDLDTYTDPVAMRALLQAQLPGFAEGRLRIESLAVRHARRNTSRQRKPCPMTLCYELQASEPARGRAGPQLLYAQVFRSGGAAAAFALQDRSRLTPPIFGQALTHLPELNLLLWALPNDPGLPQLARLLDPSRAAHELPGSAEADVQADVQVELLNYQPQQRATLRYTLIGGGSSGGGGGGSGSVNEPRAAPRTLYAKTFCDHQAAALHERFTYFWQLAQADDQAPLVAQPLHHDAVTRTLWQAPAFGTPLLRCLTPSNAAALLGRVARALARLHAAAPALAAGGETRSVAHWLAEVRRRQQKIGRCNAALAARAARVADTVEAHAAHQAARPLSLIHGDFHPEQVWVHDGRIVLFDFDEFTLGDPMEDLAEFVLKLDHAGVAPALAADFVEHYAAAAAQRFDRRSLAWHTVVQSLLQASRAYTYQQPAWAATLQRRLAVSEACALAL